MTGQYFYTSHPVVKSLLFPVHPAGGGVTGLEGGIVSISGGNQIVKERGGGIGQLESNKGFPGNRMRVCWSLFKNKFSWFSCRSWIYLLISGHHGYF